MLPGDYKQRAIYCQWAKETTDNSIAQTRAVIEENLNERDGGEPAALSAGEYTSLFLALQPPLPYGARPVSEQIFRWDTTATQFIAIQKTLGFSLYVNWVERDGKAVALDIYIGQEEISLVESKFPELEKSAIRCQRYIDACNLIKYERDLYYEAYGFWGKAPDEIKRLLFTVKLLHDRLLRVHGKPPTRYTTPPARGGLARYVDRLFAEGKTEQEIAIILRDKGLSRPVIGALLREEEGFIADYGQWLDAQGWLQKKPGK